MMKPAVISATLAVGAVLLLAVLAAALFVESGLYNIGADDHHTKPVLALIAQLRDRSIESRLSSIRPQLAATPPMIKAGAMAYPSPSAGRPPAAARTKSEIR